MRLPALVLLLAPAALAQSSMESRLREALRAANAQVQSLQEEQAQWRAKEAQVEKELEAARKELAAARKSAKKESAAAAVQKEYQEKLEAANQATARCRKEAEEAQAQARAREDARLQLAGKVDGLASRASSCEAKNARLFRVGQGILDWLDQQGPGAALMAREPFLGLKRVELENAAQDFQDRLLDQKIAPASPAAAR